MFPGMATGLEVINSRIFTGRPDAAAQADQQRGDEFRRAIQGDFIGFDGRLGGFEIAAFGRSCHSLRRDGKERHESRKAQ